MPQGAITSPQLANLVFWREEPSLQADLAADGIIYSRFVDDVTVSSKQPLAAEKKEELVRKIYNLMHRNGLKPKRSKHELMTRRDRLTVTKLTVNKTVGLPKKMRSEIRAQVHRLELMSKQGSAVESEFQSVFGKVNHMARFHPGEARSLRVRLQKMSVN